MSYQRVNWVNGAEPALNAQNLNNMDKGIEDLDNKKLDNADGSVATNNIAKNAITESRIADNAVDYTKIAKDTIMPQNTDFAQRVNLFDKSNVLINKRPHQTTSSKCTDLDDVENLITTNYKIFANEGDKFSTNLQYIYLYVYDNDGFYIKTLSGANYEMPQNSCFFLVGCNVIKLDTLMIAKGEKVPSDYVPFSKVKIDLFGYINEESTKNEIVNSATDITEKSTINNIVAVDKIKMTLNSYVSYINGNIGSAVTAVASDFVEISENCDYRLLLDQNTYSDNRGVAFYDINKKFISGIQYQSGVIKYNFTTPTNAKYLRFTSYISNIFNLQKCVSVDSLINYISNIDKPDPNNPLSDIISDAGYASIFKSFTCIGDSLTQGVFERTNGVYQNFSKTDFCCYPQQLKHITCAEVSNCGNAGAVASNSETAVLEKHSWLATADAKGWWGDTYKSACYIIALGTNDIGYYGSFSGDTSTDIDVTDYSKNDTTTSVGGYATIIQKILEIQPKARIFCVGIPNTLNATVSRTTANDKINNICKLFNENCFFIDLQKYWIAESEASEYRSVHFNGGHCNAMGYRDFAKALITYIDFIVKNNMSDFNNVQFIGTDMEYIK